MEYMIIDGAQGEGGGQVLRTALTLSILTQQPIELINIRAGRKKTGLLRQHLTSVKAAQTICDAKTDGVELGSKHIRFAPGKVKAGDYHFAIGTAGSTVLVCQTILLVLATADGESTITFEGGTHNGLSPSLCFLQQSYLPILEKMGIKCDINITRLGFNPAGGGKWQIHIKPASLKTIELTKACSELNSINKNCSINAILSLLSRSIAEREIAQAKKTLCWQNAKSEIKFVDSLGPGNSLQLCVANETHTSMFEIIGQTGLSAENVAKRAAGRVNKFLHAQAAVEEHLADQLLLPMTLAGKGSFSTTKPSLHTMTNIDVIKKFIEIDIKVEQGKRIALANNFGEIKMETTLAEDVIAPAVKAEIMRRIAAAEIEHNVKVLYAVESGSRAWGFASQNSDYDVRFIYAHKKDWYLSVDLEDKRDVIEYPIVDEIDINGWDIRKALKLFWKSNPAFIEWLQSPIVYIDDGYFAKSARELMPKIVSSHKGIYHYLHMARGNFREYLKKDVVPLKKYFYVLRPLLAIMWLEKYDTPAPIEFEVLRKLVADNKPLDDAISDLLIRKRASTEKEYAPAVPVINKFIASELTRLEDYSGKLKGKDVEFDSLNLLFKSILNNRA